MARFTLDDFIKKSKAVHGNKYDYSKVEYVNSKTKVKIICPVHGVFEQKPEKHWIGHGCPLCVRQKTEETNLRRYGVRRPLQNKEIHEKQKQTTLDRYGVEFVTQNNDIKSKRKETVREKYGVDYTCQAASVIAKKEATNKIRYGGISPFSSDKVQEKAHETIQSRYGVDNVFQNSDVRDKFEQTCMERYGVPFAIQSETVRKKIQNSCQRLYGASTPLESDEIRATLKQGVINKYGVENVMHCDEVKNKVLATKQKNHTFATSKVEDVMYDLLVDTYSKSDVVRQYHSLKYPFACDFYIKSRDLYIELNAHWTHGGHWYDDANPADVLLQSDWLKRDTEYYRNAVAVWTDSDVHKRLTAKQNSLNYITFWDNDMRDFELWMSVGSPDGHDYDNIYSWMYD